MFALLRGYWDEFVNPDGGFSIILMEGPLLIPVAMAGLFYPIETLVGVGVAAVAALTAYESYVFWRRHHPRTRA